MALDNISNTTSNLLKTILRRAHRRKAVITMCYELHDKKAKLKCKQAKKSKNRTATKHYSKGKQAVLIRSYTNPMCWCMVV
jgi:hypothetical protein